MTNPLSGALVSASETGGLRRRVATLSSLSPLTATVANGASLAITGRVNSYYPVIGDNVLVLVDDDGAAIVVGKLTTVSNQWVYPALSSGYTQRGAPWTFLRYRFVDTMNAVWFYGEIVPPANPSGLLIFTLPVGLRPKTTQGFIIGARFPGPAGSPGPLPVCQVTSAGDVRAYDLNAPDSLIFSGFIALD